MPRTERLTATELPVDWRGFPETHLLTAERYSQRKQFIATFLITLFDDHTAFKTCFYLLPPGPHLHTPKPPLHSREGASNSHTSLCELPESAALRDHTPKGDDIPSGNTTSLRSLRRCLKHRPPGDDFITLNSPFIFQFLPFRS